MWLHPDIFCVISLISCNLSIHLIVYHFTTLHSEHDEKSNDTAPSKPVSISKDKVFGQKSPSNLTSNMTSSTNSKSSTASTSSNNVQKSKVSNPQKQSAQSTTKPMKFKIIPKKVAMQKQNGNTPNSTNPSNLSNPQKASTSSTTQKPKISDPKLSNPTLSAVSSTDSDQATNSGVDTRSPSGSVKDRLAMWNRKTSNDQSVTAKSLNSNSRPVPKSKPPPIPSASKQIEEQKRLEQEQRVKEEEFRKKEIQQKAAREQAEKQRREKSERKRQQQIAAEQKRLESERLEEERLKRERLKQERLERERLERERVERERMKKEAETQRLKMEEEKRKKMELQQQQKRMEQKRKEEDQRKERERKEMEAKERIKKQRELFETKERERKEREEKERTAKMEKEARLKASRERAEKVRKEKEERQKKEREERERQKKEERARKLKEEQQRKVHEAQQQNMVPTNRLNNSKPAILSTAKPLNTSGVDKSGYRKQMQLLDNDSDDEDDMKTMELRRKQEEEEEAQLAAQMMARKKAQKQQKQQNQQSQQSTGFGLKRARSMNTGKSGVSTNAMNHNTNQKGDDSDDELRDMMAQMDAWKRQNSSPELSDFRRLSRKKSAGLKGQKGRKFSNASKPKGNYTRKDVAMEMKKSFGKDINNITMVKLDKYEGDIPLILYLLGTELESANQYGAYRLFEPEYTKSQAPKSSVYGAAWNIYTFLAKLPKPLLDSVPGNILNKAINKDVMDQVILAMDEPFASTLCFLWDILAKVAMQSGSSKMGQHQLGKVFGPLVTLVTKEDVKGNRVSMNVLAASRMMAMFRRGIEWRMQIMGFNFEDSDDDS